MPRQYVTFSVNPKKRGAGVRAQLARKKHLIYLFFNKTNTTNDGKRYNTIAGTKVFMTTPNLFYANPYLFYTENILKPGQIQSARRQLLKIAGGNHGIAKVLINNAINARDAELKSGKLPAGTIDTHKAQLKRYENWRNILGNVAVDNRPKKNNILQAQINANRNLQKYFKINENMYTKIVSHQATTSIPKHKRIYNQNPKVKTARTVIQTQKRYVTFPKVKAQIRAASNAATTLLRRTPGTQAYSRALLNLERKTAIANSSSRKL